MQIRPSKMIYPANRFLLTFVILLVLQSCANYKIHYAKPEQVSATLDVTPQGKVTHTMFLIGDAGNAAPGAIPPAVALLQDKLRATKDPKNASVVFLGDNLYPNGFAPKREEAERAIDEYRLRVQLDAVKDFPGQIFFVAGNHDWYTWGIQGLKQERKFIEEYLGRENVWLPKPGCGDPVEVELNKDLVVVLLDSEWYLADWDGHTE
ncbi:MAG: metallophosphoesterase, partial [Saprospiraceae bacterium]